MGYLARMTEKIGGSPATQIQSFFVRGRNALYTVADFETLYTDYYLHLMDHDIHPPEAHVNLFKSALAALTLHCAAQPRNTHLSWTINLQQPLLNIFLVADTHDSTVTGRVFERNVRRDDHNGLYQEIIRPGKEKMRSYVDFSGNDPLLAAERFYEQSEQRPARFFQLDQERYAILSAHPDWDEDWFAAADIHTLRHLSERETLNPIETRYFRWHCGCSRDRILHVLAPAIVEDVDGLFAGDPSITVNCPRCGAHYVIERSLVNRLLAQIRDQADS